VLSTYCFPLDLSLLCITLVFIRLHSASIGGNVTIELNLCDLDWLDYPKSHDHLEVVHLRFAISKHRFVSFLVPLQDIIVALCASDQETQNGLHHRRHFRYSILIKYTYRNNGGDATGIFYGLARKWIYCSPTRNQKITHRAFYFHESIQSYPGFKLLDFDHRQIKRLRIHGVVRRVL
jgi:hypothetical protein